jgi:SAM-dependent methyltransferase
MKERAVLQVPLSKLIRLTAKRYIKRVEKSSMPTGYVNSARYCYTVWMRHLVVAHSAGMTEAPPSVVEIGPGRSLGSGIAAMLCGANQYYAADIAPYTDRRENGPVVDEIAELLRKREPIPGDTEFPKVYPRLQDYSFPDHILTPAILEASLAPARVAAIRAAVTGETADASGIRVVYETPDALKRGIPPGSIDMVFSQAAMQYVTDLDSYYQTMYKWLRPGGMITHQMQFTSEGITRDWNGFMAVSDFTWETLTHERLYVMSRQPCSWHITAMEKAGFKVAKCLRELGSSALTRRDLAPRYRQVPDEDLETRGVDLVGVKPGAG